MGVLTSADEKEIQQYYSPDNFIIHPFFRIDKDGHFIYDLAIVVVDRPIRFSKFISPICLPNVNDDELFWEHKLITAGKIKSGF